MEGTNFQQFSNSVARILFLLLYVSTYPSTSGHAGNARKKLQVSRKHLKRCSPIRKDSSVIHNQIQAQELLLSICWQVGVTF